jgi:hypothetical protein
VFASNWRDVDDVDSHSANEALFGAGTVTAMRIALRGQTARTNLAAMSAP